MNKSDIGGYLEWHAEVPVSACIDGLYIDVTVKWDTITKFRVWLAVKLIELAAFIAGFGFEISNNE